MKVFFEVLRRISGYFGWGGSEKNVPDEEFAEAVRFFRRGSEVSESALVSAERYSKGIGDFSVNPVVSFLCGQSRSLMALFCKERCFRREFSRFLHENCRFLRMGFRCLRRLFGEKYRFGQAFSRSLQVKRSLLNDFCNKKRAFFAPLSVAASVMFCFTTSLNADALSEARQLARVGDGYFGAKKFDLAVESYQKALTFVKSPQLYYNLGQTYASLSKPGHALACFLKAETLKPRWELNKRALRELFEEYPGLSKPPFPWYHTAFRVLSKCTWSWSCAAFFWLFAGFVIFHCVVRKSKVFPIFAAICCSCFIATLTLILLNKPYESLYLLPEKTVGHYAPGDKSPMRYDWAAGTCCKIRSEAADFYFVSTLNQEDGWVKKDALISLN